MTTAHRPQLDPASGKSTLAGHPASHHSRAGQLPQFTFLKQKLAKKIEREEMKRQLLQAEGKHFGKNVNNVGAADEGDEALKAIAAGADDVEGGSPTGTKRKLNIIDYGSSDDEGNATANGTGLAAKKLKPDGYVSSSDSDSDSDAGLDKRKASDDSDSESDSDEEEDEARKKWLAEVKDKYKDVDADSESSSDSSSESEDEETQRLDEDALLARELAKIRAERAAQKAKEDAEREAEAEAQRTVNIARGNPLLNKPDYTVKKAWYDDTVFKNQARDDPESKKQRNEFINDLLRSDFNKRFMKKYVR